MRAKELVKMAFSVKELATLSGISIRTLHFYDEIGLLKPAYVSENGYRFYEKEQLLMLQQILFFKELGFKLADVRKIISSPDYDKVKTLRSHRVVLEKSAKRTEELIQTIDKTILNLEGGKEMKPKEMYLGFDKEKQREYEQYWIENGGEGGKRLVEESREKTKNWKKEDFDSAKNEFDRLDNELTKAIEANKRPSDSEVQVIVREHYSLICRFYRPTKETYVGLGQMYVTNPDFRNRYDSYHPKQAEYWAAAMKIFAERELS